jgi:NAD(P)H dehydrogenase (quinone)
MILITGAIRNFGKATIEFLLNNGVPSSRIAALVRNKKQGIDLLSKGITLRIGDYDNYSSLIEAFYSVDKLLLISENNLQKRARQHLNIVNAAKEAGLKRLLYSSFGRTNENGSSVVDLLSQSHRYSEKIIKESGVPYTIIRTNLFMDMLPSFLGDEVVQTGVYFPAGEGKASYTLRADVAETVANILASDGHENKQYYISNTENISFREIANMLQEVSGAAVMYNSPDKKNYISRRVTAGVLKEDALYFAQIGEAIKEGKFYSGKSDLESLLGRKPASLKVFLKNIFIAKKHHEIAPLSHVQFA